MRIQILCWVLALRALCSCTLFASAAESGQPALSPPNDSGHDGHEIEIPLVSENPLRFRSPEEKSSLILSFTLDSSPDAPPNTVDNPFQDVSPESPFYEAILWAVENGITNGTGPTTFSPNSPCKRKHIITFIWRACGRPWQSDWVYPYRHDEKLNPDSDFGKSANWAYNIYPKVEPGNDDSGHPLFNPEHPCSRGQAVIYLWRLSGCPKADLRYIQQFTDVNVNDETDEAYTRELPNAVAWAVENNITNGTSKTTFSPATNCSRGNIVTFLFRFSQTDDGKRVMKYSGEE